MILRGSQSIPESDGLPCLPVTRRSAIEAFTLLEMMVVIGIIAIVASLSVSIINFKNPNAISVASRQVMDDFQQARLVALNNRTTVYVVFFPTLSDIAAMNGGVVNTNFFTTNLAANNLLEMQGASYALYTKRSLGDQPGQQTIRYQSDWKTLPEGTFFATNSFWNTNVMVRYPAQTFLFPDVRTGIPLSLPYIAFGPTGQMESHASDIRVPLAFGGGLPLVRQANGLLVVSDTDMIEQPPGNSTNNYHRVLVNWVTGRSKVEKLELQ